MSTPESTAPAAPAPAAAAAAASATAPAPAGGGRPLLDLLALLVHEMKTPLTSITGYADLMLAGDVGPLTEEQREFLATIVGNAGRLTALLGELLDIERLEAGQAALRRDRVDLADVATTVVRKARAHAQRRGLTLEEGSETGVAAVGDANRLGQALAALVENGLRFTVVGSVRVACRRDGSDALLEVTDAGMGIAPADRPRLFSRCFHGATAHASEPRGNGLGLCLARAIARAHGGEATLDGEPGKGSVARLRLPATPANPANPV
ncbi:MAG: HAMP domain-containing histidine kinase [Planctomycetes bacterium]|nr:HAMP domain-containing histidine kinase [Planctomycetota bacterium]